MNLAELIALFRTDAKDTVQPYLFSDEAVTGWLNEAVVEACVRRRLLHMADDADVCRIDVVPGQSVYPLHPALYEITHLSHHIDGDWRIENLRLVSAEWLDYEVRDWRSLEGRPRFAVQDDTSIRLVPRPEQEAVLHLEGYCLPLEPMALADKDTAEPGIHRAHHAHLRLWALHRAFSIPDMEAFDPTRAARAESEFTDYFGIRPDADLRRETRMDLPHHNKGDWP